MRPVRRLLVLLLIVGAVLAGCGKAAYISPADARLEARLANVLSECATGRAEGGATKVQLQAALKPAEHLPRVMKLLSDAHARRRIREAVERLGGPRSARASTLVDSYYRLTVKLYHDAKALGVHCLERPNRNRPFSSAW
jgi:hypothetical protein